MPSSVPTKTKQAPCRVHVVECWSESASPGAATWPVETDTVFLGGSREAAEAFMRRHPNYSRSDRPWCWVVYGADIDDPKMRPHDKVVFGRDLARHPAPQQAWDAFVPGAIALAAFPADLVERTASLFANRQGSVRLEATPRDETAEGARVAWLWDALDQGWVSARLLATMLDLPMEDLGDLFVEAGFPRPDLL